MAMGTSGGRTRQATMWVPTADLPKSAGHPFYERLNRVLDEAGFDAFVEAKCASFYADGVGRPSLAPGRYFRLLLLGYFEGLDSERAIAWRAADSLSIRTFLDFALHEAPPDHSTLSRTRRLIDLETHQAVFTWVLQRLADATLVVGRTVGIDATTLEANAAMRSIVRRDTSQRVSERRPASRQIWKSYFKTKESLYDDLLNKYRQVKTRRTQIEQEARKERTLWEEAIHLFNERFFVPFTLEAKNKAAVTLGHDAMLDLSYTFHDGADEAPVARQELLKLLSQGEKKALYILNIIFEIQVRRKGRQETLFVVDDIADSFDYKNKYAIIQYLQDISGGPVFRQIILTHNFDFFRTVNSRFVGYEQCLMASKNEEGVTLKKAEGVRNPFLKDWRQHLFDDGKKRVASIAFARNLIEHLRGDSDPEFIKLTSLLHWKNDSAGIKQRDLDGIFWKLFGQTGAFDKQDEPVAEMLFREAADCHNMNGGANLEHKIVLAIAIRLIAERFMGSEISDPDFLAGIKKNQTPTLLKRFESDFGGKVSAISTLRKVILMTPENIHLNAFMYEPILDMSDDSLKALHSEVCNLK